MQAKLYKIFNISTTSSKCQLYRGSGKNAPGKVSFCSHIILQQLQILLESNAHEYQFTTIPYTKWWNLLPAEVFSHQKESPKCVGGSYNAPKFPSWWEMEPPLTISHLFNIFSVSILGTLTLGSSVPRHAAPLLIVTSQCLWYQDCHSVTDNQWKAQ